MRSTRVYVRNFLRAPPQRLEAELLTALAVIALWQAIRPLLEGSSEDALANARDWLALEKLLRLDVEPALIDAVAGESVHDVLRWLYGNLHVPALFGFLAAARLASPSRYPALRATFVLSYVPAIAVIGLYPLAPPDWLPELGLGYPPSDQQLTSGWEAWENSTAAAASQHFGFAVFIAFGSLWIAGRSWVAWLACLYPALVFVVIVGLGEHYVLDCVLGILTVLVAAGATAALGRVPGESVDGSIGRTPIALAGISAGVAAWGAESSVHGAEGGRIVPALALALGIAAVVSVSRVVLPRPDRRGPAAPMPSASVAHPDLRGPSPSAFTSAPTSRCRRHEPAAGEDQARVTTATPRSTPSGRG